MALIPTPPVLGEDLLHPSQVLCFPPHTATLGLLGTEDGEVCYFRRLWEKEWPRGPSTRG